MKGRVSKITSTGSYRRLKEKLATSTKFWGVHLLMFAPEYFWVVTIHDRTAQEKGRAIAELAWHF